MTLETNYAPVDEALKELNELWEKRPPERTVDDLLVHELKVITTEGPVNEHRAQLNPLDEIERLIAERTAIEFPSPPEVAAVRRVSVESVSDDDLDNGC